MSRITKLITAIFIGAALTWGATLAISAVHTERALADAAQLAHEAELDRAELQ